MDSFNESDGGLWRRGFTSPWQPCVPVTVFCQVPSSVTTASIDLTRAAPWVFSAARKLERIGALSHDWDSHGGLPLKPSARDMTVRAISWLEQEDLPVPAVVLGSDGTVQLEWRNRGKELEVDLLDSQEIDFVTIDRDGYVGEGQSRDNAASILWGLARWLMDD